jgi:NAD-dependent dihydropyrimidine dehydrogenase PreA subunit
MARTSEEFPGVEWVDGTGNFIRIDEERCTGCGNCIRVCLAECFEIVEKRAKIRSLELCMECASCWYVCSDGAIYFSWPKGGTGFKTNWG